MKKGSNKPTAPKLTPEQARFARKLNTLMAEGIKSTIGKITPEKLMVDVLDWFSKLPMAEQERILEEHERAKNGDALPTFKPDDYVYQFDEEFPRDPNTLFATKDNRLFLGNVEKGKVDDLRTATLVESLEWYCRCAPFSVGGSGTVELLCEMAAKELKELGFA